jgi:hypothetical protein
MWSHLAANWDQEFRFDLNSSQPVHLFRKPGGTPEKPGGVPRDEKEACMLKDWRRKKGLDQWRKGGRDHQRDSRHLNCVFDKATEFWTVKAPAAGRFNQRDWIKQMLARALDLPAINPWTSAKSPESQGCQAFILDTIFCVLGTTNKFYVEYGFNHNQHCSGSGPNTCRLWRTHGWKGLLLDGNKENHTINLHKHLLFESNIASIFQQHNVPIELDYLSSDMDSHDIFVMSGILEAGYRPRIISTEYNDNFDLDWSLAQLDPTLLPGGSKLPFRFIQCVWGSSAGAWRTLMSKHGYSLIGLSPTLDLFWIRNDLVDERWISPPFSFFFQTIRHHSHMIHGHSSWEDFDHFIVDYDVYSRTGGDISAAKAAAREQVRTYIMENRMPACFEKMKSNFLQYKTLQK